MFKAILLFIDVLIAGLLKVIENRENDIDKCSEQINALRDKRTDAHNERNAAEKMLKQLNALRS